MKYHLILSLLFFSFSLFPTGAGAQEPVPVVKGVSPVAANRASETGATYAVVVGISDYQDEGIPDLRFADKDAEAFAAFLRSPAGGSLNEDHLKVLINEQATGAQIAMELDWLIEVAKADDKVIIYFSGHGDVEAKRVTHPGYLLGWDAPSRVYMAGGAVNLRDLQIISSTLTIENKTKVVIITDACRAGKLAGSAINGSQIVGSNLSKTMDNEIKILSCQPDEYSIEGEQWGGGRGAFSYHLLDGLMGMADGNEDYIVNLKEIGRYLEDRVTEEVSPQTQNPMVVGNKTEKLTDVFPEILEQLKEGRKGQLKLFTSTDSRSVEDEILVAADSNVVEMYLAFKESLTNKNFLCKSTEDCADNYYAVLSKESTLEKLHSSMRRNYAAALQDDAQQVLNKLLKSDAAENQKTLISINVQYGTYPENLRRAAKLLGSEHYMYNDLMARSYWFEGYLVDGSRCQCLNLKNAEKVIPYYKKALEYQPEMPYAWVQLAALYGIQKHEFDTAEYYAQMAIDAVPGWILVYHWMGNAFLNKANHWSAKDKQPFLDKAQMWLEKGMAIDSNSVLLLNELAYLYNINGAYEEEQALLDRSFQLKPMAATMFFKGQGYISWKKWEEAEKSFLKAVRIDSTLYADPDGLLDLYRSTGQLEKFFDVYKKVVLGLDVNWQNRIHGWHISALEKIPDSIGLIPLLEKAVIRQPEDPGFEWILGAFYLKSGNLEKATERFDKALSLDASASVYNYIVRECLKEFNGDLAHLYAEQALEKYPREQWFLSNSITPYLLLGQYEQGLKAAERSLAIYPNDQYSLICKGIFQYEKGDFTAAEKSYKLALEGDERRRARTLLFMGILYQKTGRLSEAEKTFKKALEFGKGNSTFVSADKIMLHPRFRAEWKEVLELLYHWYPDRSDIQKELKKIQKIENDNKQ